jgi:hypothetical protein
MENEIKVLIDAVTGTIDIEYNKYGSEDEISLCCFYSTCINRFNVCNFNLPF